MCLSTAHLKFLEESNETDHAAGRASYETYVRFTDQAERCWECPLRDNGVQGDMFEACRVRLLRFYIASKRDDAVRLAGLVEPAPPEAGDGSEA